MNNDVPGEGPSTTEWLALAVQSAQDGDGIGLAEALWSSGLPQRIAFSLSRNHRAIDNFEDAEFIVAGAVDKLYTKVIRGEEVRNSVSMLWAIAGKDAMDYARAQKRHEADPLDDNARGVSLTAIELAPRTAVEADERRAAVAMLRGYVARLGPGRAVTRLWMVQVDALDNERTMTRADLAAELDITPNYVGVLFHRGKVAIQQMLREDGMADAADLIDDIAQEGEQADDDPADNA